LTAHSSDKPPSPRSRSARVLTGPLLGFGNPVLERLDVGWPTMRLISRQRGPRGGNCLAAALIPRAGPLDQWAADGLRRSFSPGWGHYRPSGSFHKPGPRCELQGPLHFHLPRRSVSRLGLSSATAALVAAMASLGDPSYQKMVEAISKETFESLMAKGGAWIGAHGDIRKIPDLPTQAWRRGRGHRP
jgi:hypothetical protein